ncbi:hypothetical protein LBMAG42_07510 [Deltaproteobacteria bacterium]|nr:hypothetical protein LBMAG42_07510 [Deltaproteobacteria bacterium]
MVNANEPPSQLHFPIMRPLLAILLTACPTPQDTGTLTGDADHWMLTWGGTGSDELWALDILGESEVIAVAIESNPLPDAVARRVGPAGEVGWTTTFGDSWSQMVYVAHVEGERVYVGGASYTSNGMTDADALLLAFNIEDGALDWSWTDDPSGGGYEEVDGLCVVGGDLVFTGWTGWGSSATNNDPMIGRISSGGTLDWVVADTAGPAWDEANGQNVCDDDRVWITGNRDGVTYAVGGQGVVAAYSTTDGSRLWQEDLDDDTNQEDGYGLAGDGEALYAVGPEVVGAQTQIEVWSTDLDGKPRWKADWGDEGADIARAIVLDGDSMVVAGTHGDELVLLRFATADGTLLDELIWTEGGPFSAHEVVTDGESVWIGGQSAASGNDQAILIRAGAVPFVMPEL